MGTKNRRRLSRWALTEPHCWLRDRGTDHRSASDRPAAGTRALLAVVLVVLLGGAGGSRASATDAGAARWQPEAEDGAVPSDAGRYFAATGHNLQEPFLGAWDRAGGEAVIGLPLSEERFIEGPGVVSQAFDGLTLVYDPTLEAPWDLQGEPLDATVRNAEAPPVARRAVAGCDGADPGCQFFAEIGHTVAGPIGDYWAASGDVPIFGLPVSEPFSDGAGITAQVFEKAVLEEEAGVVRARPLVRGQIESAGLLGDPAFQPAPPSGGTTTLVNASDGLSLRTGPGPDAAVEVVLPDSAEFIAAPGEHGDWVPGYVDGYAGWVAAAFLAEAPPPPTLSPEDWDPGIWRGAALGETNVRSRPSTDAPVVEELVDGDPLTVEAWVEGEEVFEAANLWAQLGPDRFVYARNVRRSAPVLPTPVPADAPTAGRWIDVNLTQQLITAYDGRTAARTIVTTTGMAGWETPPGLYAILSRVANETMTSGAIGAENHYKLEDVLFTQYFTDVGHAIHFAWWRTPETIGRPGSHGCLNVLLDDARFLWDWATIGTPVYVHA